MNCNNNGDCGYSDCPNQNCNNCGSGGLGSVWVPIIAIALLGGVFGGWNNNGCR